MKNKQTLPNRKRNFLPLLKRLIIRSVIIWIIIITVIVIIQYFWVRQDVSTNMGNRLLSLAKVIAPFIDGDLHDTIQTKVDVQSSTFKQLSQVLQKASDSHQTESELFTIKRDLIYTIRLNKNQQFEFVLINKPESVFDIYPEHVDDPAIHELMATAWNGEATYTKNLYRDANGYWISAYAPFYNSQKKIAGILEIDFDVQSYLQQVYMRIIWVFLEILIIALVVTMLSAWVIHRSLKPMKQLNEACKLLAQGDFTHEAKKVREDEIGELAVSVNLIKDELTKVLFDVIDTSSNIHHHGRSVNDKIIDAVDLLKLLHERSHEISTIINRAQGETDQLTTSIRELVVSVDKIDENVIKQSKKVETSTVAVEEMIASIETVAGTTKRATELTELLLANSQRGYDAVCSTEESIKEIEKSSAKINEIIKLIQGITQTTNLLAMNAAIEAAHAGQAGAGFAVVADEVRKLAHSTATAANEVITLVKETQEKIQISVQLSQQAMKTLNQINTDSKEVSNIVDEIAHAMQDQAQGAGEVIDTAIDLRKASDQTKLLTETQHHSNQNISRVINEFNQMIHSIFSAVEDQYSNIKRIEDTLIHLKESSDNNVALMGQLAEKQKRFVLPTSILPHEIKSINLQVKASE